MAHTKSIIAGRDAGVIVIDLPWPHKDLSPNARIHHMKRARLTKAAREDAQWQSCSYGPIEAVDIFVTVTAYPPRKISFDDDNFMARCKAYFDGIADSLEVNDRQFRIQPLRRGDVVKGGNVRFEIEVAG